MVAKSPATCKAPDALASIATCQQEQGDAKGAKATTDTLLAKYQTAQPPWRPRTPEGIAA